MLVVVSLGNMKINAEEHERASRGKLKCKRLPQRCYGDSRPDERCRGEISPCAGCPEMSQRKNKADQADPVAYYSDHASRSG